MCSVNSIKYILLLLLLTGCKDSLNIKTISRTKTAGVIITQYNDNTFGIECQEINTSIIKRTQDDWKRIYNQIYHLSFKQELIKEYKLENGLIYRMFHINRHENDCAFLSLWEENLRLKTKLGIKNAEIQIEKNENH